MELQEVFVALLGDLEKTHNILLDFKDKSKPFRWKVPLQVHKRKYDVIIQGTARGLPRSLRREIMERTRGIIVYGFYTSEIAVAVAKLAKLIKHIDFIIWCDLGVPDSLKVLQIPIETGIVETKEDMIRLIKKALFRAYEII